MPDPTKNANIHYSDVLSQSTIADYYVKQPYQQQVDEICHKAAHRSTLVYVPPLTSRHGIEYRHFLLDGHCFRPRVFGQPPGVWLNGEIVARYVLFSLGIDHPNPSTDTTPSFADLKKSVRQDQKAAEEKSILEQQEVSQRSRPALKIVSVEPQSAEPQPALTPRQAIALNTTLPEPEAVRSRIRGIRTKIEQAVIRCDDSSVPTRDLEAVRELVKTGNCPDYALPMLLVDAACCDNLEMVEFLLREGVDPNGRYQNWPPLFYAAGLSHYNVCAKLLAGGADPEVECRVWRTKYFFTPLSVAWSANDQKLIALMSAKMT